LEITRVPHAKKGQAFSGHCWGTAAVVSILDSGLRINYSNYPAWEDLPHGAEATVPQDHSAEARGTVADKGDPEAKGFESQEN